MRKGNKFEWQVARQLSLWLTGGVDRNQLVRSTASGGWASVNDDAQQAGDIAPNGPAGAEFLSRYLVECKHHKARPNPWHWFTVERHDLLTWFSKATRIAAETSREALLVVKCNYRPAVVAHRREALRTVASERAVLLMAFDLIVYPFEDLLAADPDDVLL